MITFISFTFLSLKPLLTSSNIVKTLFLTNVFSLHVDEGSFFNFQILFFMFSLSIFNLTFSIFSSIVIFYFFFYFLAISFCSSLSFLDCLFCSSFFFLSLASFSLFSFFALSFFSSSLEDSLETTSALSCSSNSEIGRASCRVRVYVKLLRGLLLGE